MCFRLVIIYYCITQLFTFTVTAVRVSCKTEEEKKVDWYYLYKLPKHYFNSVENDDSGLRYIFTTANDQQQGWQISNVTINDTNSFPGRTLGSLFNDLDVLIIAYNDEDPKGSTDNENGHTKGVVATDGTYGIWLVHSVPKYPIGPDYTYPITGEHFGQSFLCITFNATTEMYKIGQQLLFNEANVYFSRVPSWLTNKYPILEDVILKRWKTNMPFNNSAVFTSLNGTKFTSFAKGRQYGLDLYENWVAPTLGCDLLVETWRNSAGKLPSNCSQTRKVYNVEAIDENKVNFSFKSSADHSKWAVAYEEKKSWICVGDINRARHQFARGGGTVCQNNPIIANLYRDIVYKIENCNT